MNTYEFGIDLGIAIDARNVKEAYEKIIKMFNIFRKKTNVQSIFIHNIDVEENGIMIDLPIDDNGRINGYEEDF